MNKDELLSKHSFNETFDQIVERHQSGFKLYPIYEKHLPACWTIQEIAECMDAGTISTGKFRELVAAAIESHINKLNQKSNGS